MKTPADLLRSPSRRILAAALLLIAAACGESTTGVIVGEPLVEVLDASATPGSLVDVRLHNPTFARFSYNLCISSRLERREGESWVATPDPLRICALAAYLLPAGSTTESAVHVPLGTVAGTYRVVVTFTRSDGDRVTSASGAFTVE